MLDNLEILKTTGLLTMIIHEMDNNSEVVFVYWNQWVWN